MTMDTETLLEEAQSLVQHSTDLQQSALNIQSIAEQLAISASETTGTALSPFIIGLTVFALAVFVGYYVVWKVTPALHSPLMSVTNAISSVIIVGALVAAGLPMYGAAKTLGFVAVMLAAVNIFGGFLITHRMLEMFNKPKSK